MKRRIELPFRRQDQMELLETKTMFLVNDSKRWQQIRSRPESAPMSSEIQPVFVLTT
jgi:hypothetical protein